MNAYDVSDLSAQDLSDSFGEDIPFPPRPAVVPPSVVTTIKPAQNYSLAANDVSSLGDDFSDTDDILPPSPPSAPRQAFSARPAPGVQVTR